LKTCSFDVLEDLFFHAILAQPVLTLYRIARSLEWREGALAFGLRSSAEDAKWIRFHHASIGYQVLSNWLAGSSLHRTSDHVST
jgi:hypothetical protein